MPLSIDNAQFDQFVRFAEQAMQAGKAKTIASLGAEGATGLAARDIKPGSGDSLGAWRRSSVSKGANDAVRELFRQSVAAMFGGNDRIPEDVQKAMLLKDYGKGKPLSARRILAVQRAVAGASERILQAFDPVKKAASKAYGLKKDERFGMLDSLIETAVKATGGDEVLLSVLKQGKAIRGVLVGGNGIRSEEAIREKVAALKANVKELRAATKGNKAMFEAGLRGIANLGGKALKAGCIADMVRLARKAKIGMIRKLSATSDAGQIHAAIDQYHRNATDILKKSKALYSFDAAFADETTESRAFIGMLMLSRCSPKKLEAIDAALYSTSGAKTASLYDHAEKGHYEQENYRPELREEIQHSANRLYKSLLDMAANVRDAIGKNTAAVNPYQGQPDEEMVDAGGDVIADVAEIARQSLVDQAYDRELRRAGVVE